MPQLITYGNELIRINRGISWISRYSGSSCGTFRDLVPYNGKIIAITDKGVYYFSWIRRR